MSTLICAEIRAVWDAFFRSHYWVLTGTHTILDGTVMAVQSDRRPLVEQARANLADLNQRRRALGLPGIHIAGL